LFCGREPPVKVPGMKGREARVRTTWLHEEFTHYPEDADDAIVCRYVRVWVLHMFVIVLFLDSIGDAVSWMYITFLADSDEVGSFSWGSAMLAYLYC
jgi:hypothetical protein